MKRRLFDGLLALVTSCQLLVAGEPAGPPPEMVLNYHLMHPGENSRPGDPNAAFFLDGTYHLHYILSHPWQKTRSFAFVHLTSPDLLHWTWQPTKLQRSFTGHGMFSGTGFLTKEGKPAVIYHGQGSDRNQIAIARDNRLSAWEKPYAIEPKSAGGETPVMRHWDPDCFVIGDTYYAISGGQNPPLLKSQDLKSWTVVGDFLRHDMPDVAVGEDISCANFFRLGDKWMLLCISHPLGCRYYLGDWDGQKEQFVPTTHGRMNWRREDQNFADSWRDFFAPESVLTADGRRVMWAWLDSLSKEISVRTVQSLPRELNLSNNGQLRMRPLRELESLRYESQVLQDIAVTLPGVRPFGGVSTQKIANLDGDSLEIHITVARAEAARKRFGFNLFSDGKNPGLQILIRPETGTLRLGTTEASFAVADLAPGEDLELRIFVDKYLVEVFANDRQTMLASYPQWNTGSGLYANTFGGSTTIKKVEIWKMKPTTEGFHAAQKSHVWEPATQ